MRAIIRIARHTVAALSTVLLLSGTASAEETRLDTLFAQLQAEDVPDWETIEGQIWIEWSKSGSPAMDLLLQRGRDAMEAKDYPAAIEHFTALTDHAPDFAEGWNARATAFFAIKRYGLSIGDIQQTLALNPRHFGAMSGLGMMLEALEYDADALMVYEQAAAIHPHRPDVKEAIKRLKTRIAGQDI